MVSYIYPCTFVAIIVSINFLDILENVVVEVSGLYYFTLSHLFTLLQFR